MRRNEIQPFITAAAGLLITAMVTLSGCGINNRLDQAYSFEEREVQIAAAGSNAKAELFASHLCVVSGSSDDEDTAMTAAAGGLFNVSDASVLYNKHVFDRLNPASTTKILTVIIAIEEADMSDLVTVTEASVITESGASLAGIQPGDTLTMEQLLYGLMMPSGNDAANAIAVHMSGSVEAFAEKMNERARKLGATHTHFTNPSGLTDENHYTTAYDLYLMFNEAINLSLYRELISTPSYTANYQNAAGEPVSKTWTVGNWYQKGDRQAPNGVTVLGGKTGTTQAAGYCLVMLSGDSQGKEYISVVLNSDGRSSLYDNMTNIISKIVN